MAEQDGKHIQIADWAWATAVSVIAVCITVYQVALLFVRK